MSTPAPRGWSLQSLRSNRRFAWLLALALLLPFAQALAWAHTFSHHSVQRDDPGTVGQLHAPCATCLGAAPLHAGALPSLPPSLLAPPLVQAPPPPLASVAPRRADSLAYHSRAPPLA